MYTRQRERVLTMDEYVKKSEAINAVLLRMVSSDNEDTDLYNIALRRAASAIYDIPAADVRPVVRGKWERVVDFTGIEAFGFKETMVVGWGCNVCGYEVDASEESFNFCPNCGADMRETKHEPVE